MTQIPLYRELIGGKLRLNFHPGQMRAWDSKARFPVILAGTQWGKTCFEPDWLHREILNQGVGDYIAGTATFPLLGLKMLPEFITLFRDMLHWGKYRDSDKIIESNTSKSRIIFFSATNPESMESATAKAGVLDEAGQKQFQLQTWEAVQRRLSLAQGRCLIGTTLYSLGWLKTEVYDKAIAGDKLFEIIHGDSIDNPCFPHEEYERQRAQMPGWKFDMFYRGRYTRPVGLVYDSFSETDDVIDRFEIPKNWLIYVGHDFGSANPAAMFYAQDPSTGLFFAFHEYLPGSRSTYDHVEAFKHLIAGYNVIKRVGGNWTTEEGWRNDYTSHGWPIQSPKENMRRIENQIARVYALNKLHKVKVFRDLRHYLDQKTSFSYILDDKYQPTDKYDNEAAMHLLAAERYILSDFTPETVANRNPNWRISTSIRR